MKHTLLALMAFMATPNGFAVLGQRSYSQKDDTVSLRRKLYPEIDHKRQKLDHESNEESLARNNKVALEQLVADDLDEKLGKLDQLMGRLQLEEDKGLTPLKLSELFIEELGLQDRIRPHQLEGVIVKLRSRNKFKELFTRADLENVLNFLYFLDVE